MIQFTERKRSKTSTQSFIDLTVYKSCLKIKFDQYFAILNEVKNPQI